MGDHREVSTNRFIDTAALVFCFLMAIFAVVCVYLWIVS